MINPIPAKFTLKGVEETEKQLQVIHDWAPLLDDNNMVLKAISVMEIAVGELRRLVKLNTPQRVANQYRTDYDTGKLYGYCPRCTRNVLSNTNYCNFCGQRLEWSKTIEQLKGDD